MNIKRILKDSVSDVVFAYRNVINTETLNKGNCRILMYHAVETSDLAVDTMGLAVSVDVFETHMKYLKEEGFNVIGLEDLLDRIEKKSPIPDKSVAITFDDGFKSVLTNALPVLKKFAFKATVFVNIYFLERRLPEHLYWHSWPTLDWGEVRGLYEAGLSIGSHAFTHEKLTVLNSEKVADEIAKSKELIEKNINARIHIFSFPYGAHDDGTKKVLKDNSFRGACSSINGLNNIHSDIFALRRTEVTAFDNSLFKFKKKMRGSYDWLAMINSRGFS